MKKIIKISILSIAAVLVTVGSVEILEARTADQKTRGVARRTARRTARRHDRRQDKKEEKKEDKAAPAPEAAAPLEGPEGK